jgi:hypothetical protein
MFHRPCTPAEPSGTAFALRMAKFEKSGKTYGNKPKRKPASCLIAQLIAQQ